MKQKQFYMMSAIVAGLLMLTFLGKDKQQTSLSEKGNTSLVFPELKANLGTANTIEIKQKGNTVHLDKKNDVWVVREKHNFPAKTKAIRNLLTAMSDMRTVEKKTKKPENHPLLEVDEDKGVRLTIKAEDKLVAELIVGKQASGFKGNFIRRVNDDQVWLGNKEMDLDTAATEWIVDAIIDVNANDIVSVERTVEGEKFALVNVEGKLTITDVPEGKQLAEDYIFSGIKSSLSGLMAQDVVPASNLDWSKGVDSIYKTAQADYHVSHAAMEDKHFIKVHVVAPKVANNETEAEKAQGVDIEKLNARLSSWAFQIASYKAEGISRGPNELLLPKDDEKTAQGDS